MQNPIKLIKKGCSSNIFDFLISNKGLFGQQLLLIGKITKRDIRFKMQYTILIWIILCYMESIIDQITAVLNFNHFYNIKRLNERYQQEQVKEILDCLLLKYKQDLHDAYEILCFANIQTRHGLKFAYDTYSNIQAGSVHIDPTGQNQIFFSSSDIKELHLLALYHKQMSFQDAKKTLEESRIYKTKKYHNKNFLRNIEVIQQQKKTLISPNSTQHTPSSIVNRGNIVGNQKHTTEGISKKLLLDSNSDESQYYWPELFQKKNNSNEEQQSKQNIQRNSPEQIIEGGLPSNKYPDKALEDQKSTFQPRYTPSKTPQKKKGNLLQDERPTQKKPQEISKGLQRKIDQQKSRTFLFNWLKTTK